MARDLVYNFGAKTDQLDQGVQEVKAKLDDLLRANLEHARQTNAVYDDMTDAQKEQFRARFDSEADFQHAAKQLRERRAGEESRAIREHSEESKRVFESLEKDAEQAHKKVADSAEDGFGKAGDSAKDAGETITTELGGALGELDGTAQGAASGVLGALSGLSALIPGIGAAIGAGLATAGSIFVKGFFDDIEAAEDRVDKMAKHFIDATSRMLTEKQLIDVYDQFFNDDDMAARAQKVADAAGLPLKFDELNADGANKNLIAPLAEARGILVDTQREWELARVKADVYKRGLDEIYNSTENLQAAAELAGERLDRLAHPRNVKVTFDVDSAISAAEGKIDTFINKRRNVLVGLNLSGSGTRDLT